LFPLIATGVVDACVKFAARVVDTGSNLQICHWYQQHTTGGKFAIGVLDFRISLQIFKNIPNDPSIIFRGLGEDYSRKKSEAKNLVK
jgi:hypothetical protein